jgi:hypothetical protein
MAMSEPGDQTRDPADADRVGLGVALRFEDESMVMASAVGPTTKLADDVAVSVGLSWVTSQRPLAGGGNGGDVPG